MKVLGSAIRIFVLIGVLFSIISSAYAETVEEYCVSGNSYYRQGDFTQAISDYTKAIEMNPDYPEAYVLRAMAYYKEKEYDKSWADVYKAEELGFAVSPEFISDLKQASGRDK
jgi:tetratricopeptide (TPR) repeat protein